MPSHKFHIGESVMLRPAVSRNVPGGVYEVTKQLPHNGLEFTPLLFLLSSALAMSATH